MLKEGFQLLSKYNIKVPKYWVNEMPIHLKFPVVIKADINHKTEKNAVKLNINSFLELSKEYKKFKETFPGTDIIIQEQITGKYQELILGVKKDKLFGYLVLIGIGGIYTELLRDFIILMPEYSKETMIDRLKSLKLHKLLFGYRNLPPINFSILYEYSINLYRLAIENNLNEIEINPLLINDDEAYAVDVRFF